MFQTDDWSQFLITDNSIYPNVLPFPHISVGFKRSPQQVSVSYKLFYGCNFSLQNFHGFHANPVISLSLSQFSHYHPNFRRFYYKDLIVWSTSFFSTSSSVRLSIFFQISENSIARTEIVLARVCLKSFFTLVSMSTTLSFSSLEFMMRQRVATTTCKWLLAASRFLIGNSFLLASDSLTLSRVVSALVARSRRALNSVYHFFVTYYPHWQFATISSIICCSKVDLSSGLLSAPCAVARALFVKTI